MITVMKFDIVIGNPPYDNGSSARNNKLWRRFSEYLIDYGMEYIALVTPDNILTEDCKCKSNGYQLRSYIKSNNYGFIHAELQGGAFPGVGISACSWIIKRGSVDVVTPILKFDETVIDETTISICNKVKSYVDKLHLTTENGGLSKKQCNSGKYEIYFSGDKISYTDCDLVGVGKLKVVFPFSASYHKMFITDKSCGMLNKVFYVKDKCEGELIVNYCNSKLFRFVSVMDDEKTSGFCPFVKKGNVPDIRKYGKITDAQLYKLFKLTPEEIKTVEEYSK